MQTLQSCVSTSDSLMISSTVWALGALRLTSIARMPNSRIWMVAPAAYLQQAQHQL